MSVISSKITRLPLLLVAFVMAVSGTLFFAPQPASAETGCRYTATYTPGWNKKYYPDDRPPSGFYGVYVDPTIRTTTANSCLHIGITNSSIKWYDHVNYTGIPKAYFRVRVFNPDGSSWRTGWTKGEYTTSGATTLVTNLKNGTRYRIESSDPMYFQAID